ncbi:MAG TPA: ATP-binding protein [Thermoanaerobaculia bacterium]|nr:ATP-binding protein [Thermoanaerobaculia bacterium]
MTRPRAVVSWSSGKDSAWALETVRRANNIDIVGLLTTVTEGYGRVSMHGVREDILAAQAQRTGLACATVRIPPRCSNAVYEESFLEALARARRVGVTQIVFGDLFLEDVRRYRERMLAGCGIEPVFPLWGRDTGELAREMIAGGLSAVVVCLDPRRLARSFAGRAYDARFVNDLPPGVDPCGENGEFHTCVTGGPMFTRALEVVSGAVVEREGFVFADLLAGGPDVAAAERLVCR